MLEGEIDKRRDLPFNTSERSIIHARYIELLRLEREKPTFSTTQKFDEHEKFNKLNDFMKVSKTKYYHLINRFELVQATLHSLPVLFALFPVIWHNK